MLNSWPGIWSQTLLMGYMQLTSIFDGMLISTHIPYMCVFAYTYTLVSNTSMHVCVWSLTFMNLSIHSCMYV